MLSATETLLSFVVSLPCTATTLLGKEKPQRHKGHEDARSLCDTLCSSLSVVQKDA